MGKSKVLLIDDSDDIHQIVKKTLNDFCDVVSSYSFSDGLKKFEKEEFAIVIIDLNLDDKNGMDLLKEFKNSPKQKMRKERTTILLKTKKSNCFVGIANGIAVPIIKIKNGKTKSVGVQPCHSACAKGG